MIDRKSRDQFAEVVRKFISGQITNFDFEKNTPDTKDLVISAIAHSLWCFYDDFEEHKLTNVRQLPEEIKREIDRWIIFLHSNEEYKWPSIPYPGVRPIEYGFFDRLLGKKKGEKEFMGYGDYSVWPFISMESFNKARNDPKLKSSYSIENK